MWTNSLVFQCTNYLLNDLRFNVKNKDIYLKSQNSGVLVRSDKNTGNLNYFSVLTTYY